MTELRQRAAREPDAAPEDKVAAVSGWERRVLGCGAAERASEVSGSQSWDSDVGVVSRGAGRSARRRGLEHGRLPCRAGWGSASSPPPRGLSGCEYFENPSELSLATPLSST